MEGGRSKPRPNTAFKTKLNDSEQNVREKMIRTQPRIVSIKAKQLQDMTFIYHTRHVKKMCVQNVYIPNCLD